MMANGRTPTKVQQLFNFCRNASIDSKALSKIQDWLDQNQSNTELLETAANYQNKNNMTPLHVIVWKRPPLVLVKALIDIAPATVHLRDSGGRLPLHHACMWGASLDVLDILVRTCPESVQKKDSTGRTPSQLLKLFNAADYRNENGMLFLHSACHFEGAAATLNLVLLQLLVDAHPESITVRDNCGRTPSQLLKKSRTLERAYENGMLPLHQQAHSGGLTVHLLRLFFDAYPESIAFTDNYGMLPFHHACLNRASSLDVLKMFIELYPESIRR
jgi:ankyrin repeat protein